MSERMRRWVLVLSIGQVGCLDFRDPVTRCGADCDDVRPVCEGALAGALCDDDDPCTDGDVCDGAGSCRGTPRACLSPPGPTCADAATFVQHTSPGQCDESGACVYPTAISSCPDCEVRCLGVCEVALCDDANPCTSDTCSDGGCVNAPLTAICDDGDACTYDDQCQMLGDEVGCAGTLVLCPGLPGACAPEYSCNGTSICTESYPTGTSCDDENACTGADTCDGAGSCAGLPRECAQSVATSLTVARTCPTGATPARLWTMCEDPELDGAWNCSETRFCTAYDAAHECDPSSGCRYGDVILDVVTIVRTLGGAAYGVCPSTYDEVLAFPECHASDRLCEGTPGDCCDAESLRVVCALRGPAAPGASAVVDLRMPLDVCGTLFTELATIPLLSAEGTYSSLAKLCVKKIALP